MTYEYKCTKCQSKLDIVLSIKEEQPKAVLCPTCKAKMAYSWAQFSKSSVFIPERHRA